MNNAGDSILEEEEKRHIKERIEELSQKLFNKASKDIKYLYVTNYIHHLLLEEELTRTGLYQWLNVFNGDIKQPRDIANYEDYDIVHVNLASQDIHLVGNIREKIPKGSKTKLVVNNDYTTELWGTSFEFPSTISREIREADMLFGTEYFQTTALSELTKRKCYVIPHPADIKRLKVLNKIQPKNLLSTIWRRYDQHIYTPHLVTRDQGLTTQLLGYDPKIDRRMFLTTTLYDYVYLGTNYMDFCDQLRESKVIYDPFTFHSFSRTTVDTAALGVPVVVSNRTQSGNICYPYTTVDPYDVYAGRKMIRKLLDDEEFRKLVIDTAYKNCEFYNHQNSMERYLSSLEESIREERKSVTESITRKDRESGKGQDAVIAHEKQTIFAPK